MSATAPTVTSQRKCPECDAPRSETGGAFCGSYCERMWRQGRSEEFEVDVAAWLHDNPQDPWRQLRLVVE